MKKLKLLLATCALMGGVFSANAQLEDGKVYWIQDVSTRQFISQGASWGTQATVQDVGGLGLQAVYVSEGVYKLKNIMWNKGNNADLGMRTSDRFLDQGAEDITLIVSGDGYKLNTTNGGYISNNSDSYTAEGVRRLGNTSDEASATVWKFLTKDEYDAAIQAYKDSKAATYATNLGYNSVSSVSELEAILATDYRGVDKTSNISNASLNSNWNGWTHGATDDSHRNEGAGIGNGCAEFWNGCGYAKQTVSGLPNGLYKVEFVGTFRPKNADEANNIASGEASSPAYVYANDAKIEFLHWIDVPAKANGRSGITKANGYGHSFYTYVSDGTLNLGVVQGCWENNYMWCPFGQFTLTYYSNEVSDADINALIATIPTRVSDKQTALLTAAKETLETTKTIADYNALATAIQNAQASANEYAIIDAGTVPTDGLDGWAKSTTNGTLECNGWSEEGKTDGSEMTTPFVQDWVSSGTALAGGDAGGKLYYSFTDLNPNEKYVVTARVRVFNESGTGVTGATYFVGENSKSLETFGAACTGDYATKGKFAVLSCVGTVDNNGKLQFGVELDASSPINWIAIKDVTIAAGTGDLPTDIELNKSSVQLTTGGFTTLTATIDPSTADEKTILWSSSDETVATVAGGYVVALKAGSATITATSFAIPNVNATCTVTVTDASAPSDYSTTIAAGDYYIYNAATGTFLGGGNNWGTQASLIEHGIPFTIAVGDGVYTLDSHTYNNANDHFLNGTYVDGASTNLYITSISDDGKFSISTADGSDYLTALAGSTVVSNSAANTDSKLAQWYFLSKKDRDKMLAAATANTPADATYYVKQANISRNLSAGAQNENAWSQYNVGGTQDNSNFVGQVYNATVDNYQTIENIPNGTYTVTVQAFTSSTDVKFYANDEKVDVRENNSGATSCSAAAALFAQGLYPNTVTVTVTDRTLKIGFEGDCTGKWLCYDNVEVYMTNYTPNTGLTASIDNAEFEAGTTATITAATNPANASFNAITYTSDNEEVATVDVNGVVTGLSVGTANITVAATEMEEFTQVISVTVKATAPTALALSPTTNELNATTIAAELTVIPTPDNANTSVTWASSDPTVATVENGVVTAVSTGTATITATSTVDPTVRAEATVTVSFPESTVPATYYVNDDATRTIYTLGENLIKNGSFEYPNAVYGWTTGTGSVNAMSTDNFNIPTEGAADGSQYLQAKESKGGADAKSINTSWALENGKTYVFGYKIKANKQCTTDLEFIGTSLSNNKGQENSNKKFETSAYGTDWQNVTYTFTNTDNYKYLVFNARWMGSAQSFDNFYLCEATVSTVGNVDYATAVIPTANIGTGAFQYSQDAIDAANALVQGTATVAEVEAAYEAVTTINEPADGEVFNVMITTSDNYAFKNNPLTFNVDNASGADFPKNIGVKAYRAQQMVFTKVSGNNYTISTVNADNQTVYIGTNKTINNTGGTNQIRLTTDATKALSITVDPTAEGIYNLLNTENSNNKLGCQDPDSQNKGGLYTTNSHSDFTITLATKPSVAIAIDPEVKYATRIFPFKPDLPDGIIAYSCEAHDGDNLVFEPVADPVANVPYILYAENGYNGDALTGFGTATETSYEDGYLTGVYENTLAPADSYVLMKDETDGLGFYQVVGGDGQPTVGANRAYLTVPASSRAAFFFDGKSTGLNDVRAKMSEVSGDVYNLNGQRVTSPRKGLYIMNGKKVVVK